MSWRTQARSYRAPSLVVETSAALVGIAHAPHWSNGPHSCRNRASCARRVGGRVRAQSFGGRRAWTARAHNGWRVRVAHAQAPLMKHARREELLWYRQVGA